MKTFFVVSLFCLSYLICGSIADKGQISLDMFCSDKVKCTFTFTNNGLEDIRILKHNTPLEGLNSQFVTVYSETGKPLKYKGLYVYHAPATKDSFVLVKAGKSISATVDITHAYSIDSDGLYTIEYSKPVHILKWSVFRQPYLQSAIVHGSGSIYLKDTHLLSKPQVLEEEIGEQRKEILSKQTPEDEPSPCHISFTNGGTTEERNDITNVHKRICKKVSYVKDKVRNYNRYNLWFGTYTTQRANEVRDVYDKIAKGLAADTVTYNMNGPSCKSDWAAYTQHDSRTVYICTYIHGLSTIYCPNSDNIVDNKESIMLHEWTHAYGYTADHSYGSANDQNLATKSPNLAIENADNLERYYCPASYE